VNQFFASLSNTQNGAVWSVMLYYDEHSPVAQPTVAKQAFTSPPNSNPKSNYVVEPARRPASDQPRAAAGPDAGAAREPVEAGPPLNEEQIRWIIALKRWRADQAAQEGVPLYMVAHNKWLEEIVRMPARGFQDLLRIRGMGEWRAKKYADKILGILNPANGPNGPAAAHSN
jgi:superfamily II DNA helicase RecQ